MAAKPASAAASMAYQRNGGVNENVAKMAKMKWRGVWHGGNGENGNGHRHQRKPAAAGNERKSAAHQ